MKVKDNVVSLNNPLRNEVEDMLTEIAREGARKMLATALEQEVNDFLAKHKQHRTEVDKARFVRNGYLPSDLILLFRTPS